MESEEKSGEFDLTPEERKEARDAIAEIKRSRPVHSADELVKMAEVRKRRTHRPLVDAVDQVKATDEKEAAEELDTILTAKNQKK